MASGGEIYQARFSETGGAVLITSIMLSPLAACTEKLTTITATLTKTATKIATETATKTITENTTEKLTETAVRTFTTTITETLTETPTTKLVIDMAGNMVYVPVNAQRIAFPWANQYEIMMMAGITNKCVAIHPNLKKYVWLVKYTPEITDKCTPFSGIDVDIELLLTTNPDLLFALETFTETIAKCNTVGLPVVILSKPSTIQKIRNNASLIAKVLGGDAEIMIQRYDTYVNEKLTMINSKLANLTDEEKPTVACIIVDTACKVSGTNTIMDEWSSIAGGKNIAQEFTGYKEVNAEQLLMWNPDVLIVPSNKWKTAIMTGAEYVGLAAVKNDRVFINPHGFFDWQYTAPTVALQIQWAAQMLHPDLLTDVDIREEIKYYHKILLGVDLLDEDVETILYPEVYEAT
jgi:iron complex transport system substrate-binding protein